MQRLYFGWFFIVLVFETGHVEINPVSSRIRQVHLESESSVVIKSSGSRSAFAIEQTRHPARQPVRERFLRVN